LREIKSCGFALRAGEPAAEIAQRQEVCPHLRVAGADQWKESGRCRVAHWGLIPTDLTISAQRFVSLSIRVRNCPGEAWDAVTPSGTRRVANSGESSMALSSLLGRGAIPGGGPAGASTPHQCSTTRSTPASLKVGIFDCV